jgi:hypothetical protein
MRRTPRSASARRARIAARCGVRARSTVGAHRPVVAMSAKVSTGAGVTARAVERERQRCQPRELSALQVPSRVARKITRIRPGGRPGMPPWSADDLRRIVEHTSELAPSRLRPLILECARGKGPINLVRVLQRTKGIHVAARCGASSAAVSAWANGLWRPNTERRRLLFVNYGIPVESWEIEPRRHRRQP